MLYFCDKCGKETEFEVKDLVLKAGDNGYCKSKSYVCTECGFTPLFAPKGLKS